MQDIINRILDTMIAILSWFIIIMFMAWPIIASIESEKERKKWIEEMEKRERQIAAMQAFNDKNKEFSG